MSSSREWDRWEAYFTPGPVAEQGLRLLPLLRSGPPQSLLDLGAGAGVFGQRAGLVFPTAHRVGIEIRKDERGAARHYESFLAGDFFDVAPTLGAGFDLIVSNPPFSRTREAIELARSLLSPRGVAIFFVRSTFGQAKRDIPLWLHNCPSLVAELVGRVNMRRGLSKTGRTMGGDNVGHKWLVIERRPAPAVPLWQTLLMPPLPKEMRRWVDRPGTERRVTPLPPSLWPGGPHDAPTTTSRRRRPAAVPGAAHAAPRGRPAPSHRASHA